MTDTTECPLTSAELRRLAQLNECEAEELCEESVAILNKLCNPEQNVYEEALRLAADLMDERDQLRRELEEAEAAICILTQQAIDGTATYYDKPYGVYEDEHEGFNAIHRAHERAQNKHKEPNDI